MSPQPRTTGSLRRRLAVQLIGAAAVLAVVLIVLFRSFATQIAQESQDSVLLASATSIIESISAQGDRLVADIPYAALAMLGRVSDDRVFYRIDQGDAVLTGYEDLPVQPLRADASFGTTTYQEASVRVVTLSRLLATGGNSTRVVVTLAQTQEGLAARLQVVSRQAIGLGAGFFVIAAILSLFAVNRVFRPLNALAGAVARRGPNDLRRFRAEVPDEMAPLVSALNDFTGRLSRALERSEDFITEAAHRVRTPLATVRAQAEVILWRMEREQNRAALKDMIRAVDESSRAAGQLLDQAMVNLRTDALERSMVDLATCLEDPVARLSPLAGLRDITLRPDFSRSCAVPVDAILIHNALTNIIDNAIKYAPPETEVRITTGCTEDSATITVSDEGPGFGSDDTTALKDRFVRGAASSGKIGSGLGLTIAAQVVEAHGGALHLTNTDRGGACVTLSLPR